MNHVVGSAKPKDYIDVYVNHEHVIVCEMHGRMTAPLVRESLAQTKRHAAALAAAGRPALLFIDASKVTGQDSGARRLAKTMGGMGLTKVAIYNRTVALAIVISYLIRTSDMSRYARSFRSRRAAMGWLQGDHETVQGPYHVLRLTVAFAVALIASGALVGWMLDNEVLKAVVPGLKPMNPLVALLLLGLAAATFAVRQAGLMNSVRTRLVATVGFLTAIFGVLVLMQTRANSPRHIDGLLFHDALGAGGLSGYTSARTALVMVLLGIMLLAIVGGQRERWQQYLFHTVSAIVFVAALTSIVGYGFGSGDLYANAYLLPMPLNSALCVLLLTIALQTVAVQRPFFARVWEVSAKYSQPLIICTVIILITGVAWHQSVQNHERVRATATADELLRKKDDIQDRVSAYVNALRGYRSFFESSEYITADEFQVFYRTSELEKHYPGFNAISFARAVPTAGASRSVFEREMRGQASSVFPLYGQYRVYPQNNGPHSYPITYLQPTGNSISLGFDLATSPERRQALERARDTNDVAATGKIDLNASRADANLPERPGFFITIPVYRLADGASVQPQTVEQRRAQLYGFVNAIFEDEKLFADVFDSTQQDRVAYMLRNARTGEVRYNGRAAANVPDHDPQTTTLQVAGQTWQLALYASPHFGDEGVGRYMPQLLLAGGVLVAALATALSVGQVRRKDQALALAAAMTEDLNRERDEALTVKQKDEAILSSIGDAVFAIDTEGRIILFNRTAEEITGSSGTEALGRPYKELFHFMNEQDGRMTDRFVKAALDGKRSSMPAGTVLRRIDGTLIPVADSAAPIVNAQGRVEGAVIVFRDVTRERELVKMKDEFVSMASHELRTPMGAIRAFVSMILAGDYGRVNKNLIEPLNDIKASTLRLVNLVNDLLNVARIEAGRMKFTLEDVALHTLLQGAIDTLGPLARERKLALNADFKRLPSIQADSDKVVQVITNLVGNALKFTDEGGITIGAAASADTVIVTVTDTGTGISEADQAAVFGKFEQVSSVQEGRPAGTGLGLYISREMIRKMGGELWIQQSELGKGTTFAFMLPCSGTPLAKRVKIDRGRDEKIHPDAV